jgi:hypothetical protein
MLNILTQDHIPVDDAQVQTITQRGPFPSFPDAVSCIQDVVGRRRPGRGLSDTAARQITTELMARKIVRLDPVGSDIALTAHIRLVLEGHPLHPAIISRVLDHDPHDLTELEIALAKAAYVVYNTRPRISLITALADYLAQSRAFDITLSDHGKRPQAA